MVLEGHVVQKRINIGSKSEHAGDFKLRRQGGHPIADPHVQALVGKRIRAEGIVSAGQFIMDTYEVIRA